MKIRLYRIHFKEIAMLNYDYYRKFLSIGLVHKALTKPSYFIEVRSSIPL